MVCEFATETSAKNSAFRPLSHEISILQGNEEDEKNSPRILGALESRLTEEAPVKVSSRFSSWATEAGNDPLAAQVTRRCLLVVRWFLICWRRGNPPLFASHLYHEKFPPEIFLF